jgi:octaprenyl-diphosphate synthase
MGMGSYLSGSLTVREIFQLVRDDLKKAEEEFCLESVASAQAITHIANHLQTSGGKRLRPTLVLLCSKLFPECNRETAIHLASVVELIHTATLIHDDVIDDAQTRRGKESTNVIFGNQTSVLSGDWLYMQAFRIALRERDFRLLDLLIGLTQMMVEGELVQFERLGRLVTRQEYLDLIDRKTAALFSCCARLGAIAGAASEEEEKRLSNYAWNLGMAFQLVDDILDFTSSEKKLGKPVGSDLREGKVTLPLLIALQDGTADERSMVEKVLEERNYNSVSFEQIRAFIERYEGIERARQFASNYTSKASVLISQFAESPAQRALMSIPDFIIQRDH